MRWLAALALCASLVAQIEVTPNGTANPALFNIPFASTWLPGWHISTWTAYAEDPPGSGPDLMTLICDETNTAYSHSFGRVVVLGMIGPASGWVGTDHGPWVGTDPIVEFDLWPVSQTTALNQWWCYPNIASCAIRVNVTDGTSNLFQLLPPGITVAWQTLWYLPDQYGGYAGALQTPILIST